MSFCVAFRRNIGELLPAVASQTLSDPALQPPPLNEAEQNASVLMQRVMGYQPFRADEFAQQLGAGRSDAVILMIEKAALMSGSALVNKKAGGIEVIPRSWGPDTAPMVFLANELLKLASMCAAGLRYDVQNYINRKCAEVPLTRKWTYSVHPGVKMGQAVLAGLKEKTGRTIDEWIDLVDTSAATGEKERIAWLKAEHGLGTNYAGWIVERASGGGDSQTNPETYLANAVRYVEQMFDGPKAGLRPAYDQLLELAFSLGDDVKVCPATTIVPIYRNHVIAQIKPSTRTRIDFGFALKGVPASGRLQDLSTKSKGNRITHSIPIARPEDVDEEVEMWLKKAYALDV